MYVHVYICICVVPGKSKRKQSTVSDGAYGTYVDMFTPDSPVNTHNIIVPLWYLHDMPTVHVT